MKIGPNDEVQTVVGNEPFLPLVENPDLTSLPFTIHPNPAEDYLHLNLPEAIEEMRMVDAQGQLLLQQPLAFGSHTLDVSHLRAGIYFIQCGQTIRKWVKQ
jgi:hypothetical protein